MAIRVAINGFGRIGRLFFRQALQNKNFTVVAINDLGDLENLAYLLQHDSVYGTLGEEVRIEEGRTEEWGRLDVGGKTTDVFRVADAAQLPWKKMEIDVVVESTGVFESYEKAQVHLKAGAKHVVISAPAKDEDGSDSKTVLMGVNEKDLQGCRLSSNGSCTTNSIASVIQVLHEHVGVQKAVLNTTHAYTATQSIVDGPVRGGKDFRRGRAAGQNIVPSSTGAAIAVARVIPDMKDKFDGIALRVPVVAGSIADVTFLAARKTSVEEINEVLEKAAKSPKSHKKRKRTQVFQAFFKMSR